MFFDFFGLLLLWIFLSVEDNRAHHFSQMFFLTKILIQYYRGLSFQEKVIFDFFGPSLQNDSKDFSNFLHEFRGQQGPSFEPDGFSEKVLNPAL